jgi:hypothetical protein
MDMAVKMLLRIKRCDSFIEVKMFKLFSDYLLNLFLMKMFNLFPMKMSFLIL